MGNIGVRTQDLRDFTVHIRKLPEDYIVGTGVAVSMDGKVATCAHVVAAAGVDFKSRDGREVGVFFPKAREGAKKMQRAKVAAYFPEHDDDVVLLQLVDGPAPLAPEQLPKLGRASGSESNIFRSYGYRRLVNYLGGWAEGTILGHVEDPGNRRLQEEALQLRSPEINQGMSGAAVLDTARNLVVGLVSETWITDATGKDRDTAWAVDARVLSLEPLGLALHDQTLPKREALTPAVGPETREAAEGEPGLALHNAPEPLAEWVGREDLLRALNQDWTDPDRRLTGLIGFGGEGKSSLARRWIENLHRKENRPQGVFWWGFYEKRSVEEFLGSALDFFSGGRLDPLSFPSAMAQAHLVAGMLATGRYLLVLDGLEVLQHQEGDRYGEVTSQDLREFLQFLAAPGHESFCLITSRAPLLDLLAYTTYGERPVERLSPADGLALLRNLGIQGPDEALTALAEEWEGHALILSLVGSYLKEQYGGDAARAGELPRPTAADDRYSKVQPLLRHYDGILSPAELEFLMIFSTFRLPVPEAALGPVFWERLGEALSLDHLRACRLLRFNEATREYTTHPLIRGHYAERLATRRQEDPGVVKALHRRIKGYYLTTAGEPPEFPTMEELSPFIEAVHHACQAEEYDAADDIRKQKVYQGDRKVLIHQLGAYETALGLYRDFFPEGDLERDPLVRYPWDQGGILNNVGLTLMNLGRLAEADGFLRRSLKIKQTQQDRQGASATYQNLAELRVHRGELARCREAAAAGLSAARDMQGRDHQCGFLAYEGWAAHLQGDVTASAAAFGEASELQRKIDPTKQFLYSNRGLWLAENLRRIGNRHLARQVTSANREICQRNRWTDNLSGCHRLLGELDADDGDDKEAREHFRRALELARSISRRDVLIEALSSRGRSLARRGETAAARRDLEEGLGYATTGGYRIYEANLRVGLAWAFLKEGNIMTARQEAELTLSMSREMGYYWGQVDAYEVLKVCRQGAAG